MKWCLAMLSGLLLLAGCHTAVVPKEATLKVEAGLVFSYGGPQPVAREKFYLSSKGLPDILASHGTTPDQFILTIARVPLNNQAKAKVEAVIADITQASLPPLMTDFTGHLTTTAPPGQYHLISMTSLRGNIMLWSVPVTLTAGQESQLTLDQHNALK